MSFWAEGAREIDGKIEFQFPNGERHRASILERSPPHRFSIQYFDARTTFELTPGADGSILTLSVYGAPESDWLESYAGWVSVLMNMKSVIDFGADLRNHDPEKSWDQGFVDN